MTTILDEFDGDHNRMARFAWYQEGNNPYAPPGWVAQVRSYTDEEYDRNKDANMDPLSCLNGMSKMDIRAQASAIRGLYKEVMREEDYALIELRLCVGLDSESHQRRNHALLTVITNTVLASDMRYDRETIKNCCRAYGGYASAIPSRSNLMKDLLQQFRDAVIMGGDRIASRQRRLGWGLDIAS